MLCWRGALLLVATTGVKVIGAGAESFAIDCTDRYAVLRTRCGLTAVGDAQVRTAIKEVVFTKLLRKVKDGLYDKFFGASERRLGAASVPAEKVMGRHFLESLKKNLESMMSDADLDDLSEDYPGSGDDAETSTGLATLSMSLQESELVCLDTYLEGALVDHIFSKVVDDISFSVFPGVSISASSPMVNLGDALCRSAAEVHDDTSAVQDICTTFDLLKHGLVCNAQPPHVDCHRAASAYINKVMTCTPVELEVIDEGTNITRAQGLVDRWLFGAIDSLYQYAKFETTCGKSIADHTFLPGWKLLDYAVLDYEGLKTPTPLQSVSTSPITIVLTNKKHEYLVVNRGSIYPKDWLIDFNTEQVPLVHQRADGSNVTLGRMPQGYHALATPLSEFAIELIERDLAASPGNLTEPSRVTITGHSMGVAVGAAQALVMSERWDYNRTKLAVVGFGSPSTLDAQAASYLVERATVRNWANEFDPVSRLTCATAQGMPRCRAGSGMDHYVPFPNTILIKNDELASYMPNLHVETFGELSYSVFTGAVDTSDVTFPAPTQMAQLHTCAYECFMHSRYCGGSQSLCSTCSLV